MLKFTPHKPKSVWSQLNKTRVEKLNEEKKMMPAGFASIETTQKNGSWETLAARTDQTVLMAAANKKPGPQGFKL
jgi:uncharacterized protein YdeI (YjbR/CyaY-like superfamily)